MVYLPTLGCFLQSPTSTWGIFSGVKKTSNARQFNHFRAFQEIIQSTHIMISIISWSHKHPHHHHPYPRDWNPQISSFLIRRVRFLKTQKIPQRMAQSWGWFWGSLLTENQDGHIWVNNPNVFHGTNAVFTYINGLKLMVDIGKY